ncbi:MAG: TatD family hydrolase [Glaciecola sp.]|jgi:TatD DNase family protein
MIDTHCHLDLDVFNPDIAAVIERAQRQGVTKFVIPAIDPQHWQRQYHLASIHPSVFFTLGYHPFFLAPLLAQHSVTSLLDTLRTQWFECQSSALQSQCLGFGEIGLDRSIAVPLAQQEAMCLGQLRIAQTLQQPVILHHRKSHDRLLGLIRQAGFTQGGIIHAFSGSVEVAQAYIKAGFMLGIGGTITYPRGSKTRQTLAEVGLAHCVLETDSPDMPMSGRQGLRNEPAHLVDVVQCMAQLFAMSSDVICAQTTANALQVFPRLSVTV